MEGGREKKGGGAKLVPCFEDVDTLRLSGGKSDSPSDFFPFFFFRRSPPLALLCWPCRTGSAGSALRGQSEGELSRAWGSGRGRAAPPARASLPPYRGQRHALPTADAEPQLSLSRRGRSPTSRRSLRARSRAFPLPASRRAARGGLGYPPPPSPAHPAYGPGAPRRLCCRRREGTRSPPARPAVSRGDLATSGSAFRGGESHRPPRGSQEGREELPSPHRDSRPPPPPPAAGVLHHLGSPSRPRSPRELTWCRARRCQGGQPAPPRAEGSPGSARAPLRGERGEEGVAARFPPPAPPRGCGSPRGRIPLRRFNEPRPAAVLVGGRAGPAARPGGCPAECSPVERLKRSTSKR